MHSRTMYVPLYMRLLRGVRRARLINNINCTNNNNDRDTVRHTWNSKHCHFCHDFEFNRQNRLLISIDTFVIREFYNRFSNFHFHSDDFKSSQVITRSIGLSHTEFGKSIRSVDLSSQRSLPLPKLIHIILRPSNEWLNEEDIKRFTPWF